MIGKLLDFAHKSSSFISALLAGVIALQASHPGLSGSQLLLLYLAGSLGGSGALGEILKVIVSRFK